MTNYHFIPMTREHATAIVDTWKYDGEYAIYDYTNEAEHMLDPSGWGQGVFAVLNQAGELIGELSIEFLDEDDHYTEYDEYGDEALVNSRDLWVGFGLRPDLVGQGLGSEFVIACVAFAVERWGYRGKYARLGVAVFNQRAIRAYEKAGFQVFHRTMGDIHGQTFECVHMRKKLRAGTR